MRIAFAGTTEFGIPTLEKLMSDGHELLFVITQPDKPTGRKQELSPTPIKSWAIKKNLQVLTPQKIIEVSDSLKSASPDVLLVAAYGQIVPKDILDIPKYGSINIHGSVLPKYRGASPIQAALLNSEKETGITLIKMDEKMDHGPVLGLRSIVIDENDNFSSLYIKLAKLSSDLSSEIIPKYISGELKPIEQDHTRASFTKMLTKADGRIDWSRQASATFNQIRALNPEPGTWTTLEGKIVKIIEAKILNDYRVELPGKIYQRPEGLTVKTSDQSLILLQVQPEGKTPMTGREFLNGLKNRERLFFI